MAPRAREKHAIRVLGVMTGTSCDGMDAACVEIDPRGWRPLWAGSAPFPRALRKRVLAAQKPGTRLAALDWLKLDRDLGDWHAATLARAIADHPPGARPHVVASHGQTVAHFPSEGVTLQLGAPARVARATGLSVVSSFRAGDLAAGGQGAPLVPRFHVLLAHHLGDPGRGVSVHNIGGISNLSYVGPGGEVIAFDTGPGNAWIDAAAELATGGRSRMDKGGLLALKGTPDARAVASVLRLPYFSKPGPKSTGRDQFAFEVLLSRTRAKGADLVATATAVTVESMTLAYRRFVLGKGRPLERVFFAGGGANNPALVEGFRSRMSEVEVRRLDDAGLDGQLVEAQAFAYLAFLSLLGTPLGGPWTGAEGFGPPAQLTPGENWDRVLSILHGIRSRL